MNTLEIILIVSISAIILGFGLFFLIRHLRSRKKEPKYDFITKYGTKVMLSPKLQNLTVKEVEAWTDAVVSFWYRRKGWDKDKGYEMVGKATMKLYDKLYLKRMGTKVNGILWPSSFVIEIATLPKQESNRSSIEKVASLFRHETSHIICEHVGGVDPGENFGEIHHQLFAKTGLGA